MAHLSRRIEAVCFYARAVYRKAPSLRLAVLELVLVAIVIVGIVLAWVINAQRRLDRRRERWLAGNDRSL
jgi:hypothetical protein